MSNQVLLSAALSAITNSTIVPYDDYSGNNPFIPHYNNPGNNQLVSNNSFSGNNQLDEISLHQSHLIGGKVPTNNVNDNDYKPRILPRRFLVNRRTPIRLSKQNCVFVKTLTGKTITVVVDLDETIDQLKTKIHTIDGIPPNQQKLIFAGRLLVKGDSTLAECNIQCESTIYILRLKCADSPSNTLFIHPDQLDPKYDYDFTNINDNGLTFMRGNFEYKRPCGWKRIALNVLNKYEDNAWLGVGKRKYSTCSVQNEWPVSYHGTAKNNCKSIAEDGYLLCKGKRFLFGHGIYSTPDIDVAYQYATKFNHDGDDYRVVFQNRVNPNNLIRISKGETGVGEYWISPDGADLRPYGICIKKVIN
ncbi:ubiquitin-domain-containing protein [Rhizophagus irregularis]|uniref:Ubiquitin-domain-containing protein n=4 Tax=Rhizophagus irregularis TaxID=588596 RepID=A0A2I1EBI3_9GLOM|nr:ubiquitin-ribosomal 60S subunit protein L40B fusion protein [Rhizophagus irregularis DAOM 197198w]PKC03069.1 ubiquitin-domain-containing protein [Rhizophagus irregularis]GBC42524.1 hypothetical protein GLOIN_2v1836722 [Rhizophagus irregularis DAOM 181602=DAOM 197198]PKC63033.1 ubiquitin-domain-containing protein [Rhizophagus irregularis]PKY19486.1 ubiquitin-domain-containing protein [Rhizophagus irregularis]